MNTHCNVIVVILCACAWLHMATAAHAELSWRAQEVDVDVDVKAGEARAKFEFSNVGTKPVSIKRVQTSCGCTSAKPAKDAYKPGESGEVAVRVSLGNLDGGVTRSIVVETDDEESDRVLLLVKIRCPKLTSCEPLALHWTIGDPESKTVVIKMEKKPYRLTRVLPSPFQKCELTTVREGGEYRLIVKRPEGITPDEIEIETDCLTEAGIAKIVRIHQTSAIPKP